MRIIRTVTAMLSIAMLTFTLSCSSDEQGGNSQGDNNQQGGYGGTTPSSSSTANIIGDNFGYCDFGPITQWGGGCFKMEHENDCDLEWGQIVNSCSDTMPSGSSIIPSSSSITPSSSSRVPSSSSVISSSSSDTISSNSEEEPSSSSEMPSSSSSLRVYCAHINIENCTILSYPDSPNSKCPANMLRCNSCPYDYGGNDFSSCIVMSSSSSETPSSSSEEILSSSSETPSSSSVTPSSSSHVHVWGAWTTTTTATCARAGIETRTCSNDPSHSETRPITQLSWGAWTTTTAATCGVAGVETRTCPGNASPAETRSIPKITLNSATEFCYNNSIVKKCIGNTQEFDPAKYECKSGKNGVYLKNNTTGYEAVLIGNQVWMAENSRIHPSGTSWCYKENSSNCNTYGRLYRWETATRSCPTGWHLPSNAEWKTLTDYIGGSANAGAKLKAKSSWNSNGNGTDDYGFAALPGGRDELLDDVNLGTAGYWWSATEDYDSYAYVYYMASNRTSVSSESVGKSVGGQSVRCVKD